MTDTTKQAEWPEKVYLETWNSNIGVPHFSCNGSKDDSECMKYIREDLVEARELAIVKAALEAAIERLCLTYNERLDIRRIDPTEILKGVTR